MARLRLSQTFSDPEGLFYWAHVAAGLGEHGSALGLLSRAVDSGLYCVRGFEVSPLLSGLRRFPAFDAILERARVRQRPRRKRSRMPTGRACSVCPSTRTEFHTEARQYAQRDKSACGSTKLLCGVRAGNAC